MKKKTLRIVGILMAVIAIALIAFAITHPEMSFPWSNTVTYALYCLYTVVTVVLLIAPIKNK